MSTTKIQWGIESRVTDGWHLWTGWHPSREAAVATAMHFADRFSSQDLRLVKSTTTIVYEYEPFTHTN